MPPLGKEHHFEILRAVLALAEEQGSVALDEAAATVGLSSDELRRLLEPVLYLEYHTPDGTLIGEERAFLLTESGHLHITGDHWLRDLAADPPAADASLRLLVAALTIEALATKPTPDLDDAAKLLRGVVATELQIPVDQPACLGTVDEAHRDGRSVRFRYMAADASEPHDMEVLPYRVFCKWGHWYVHGRIVDEHEARYFRVDRMLSCEPGGAAFEPPDDDAIPDWFDLSAHARTVRVRAPEAAIDVLPQPLTLGDPEAAGEGWIEVDITVAGDRRLEHLLVCLPPQAEVVAPEEYKALRREHARSLLEQFIR